MKTTVHINSTFNLLLGTPLMNPCILSSVISWNSIFGIRSSYIVTFSWASSTSWNLLTFKWGLIFGKRKVLRGEVWGIWRLYLAKILLHYPHIHMKISSQNVTKVFNLWSQINSMVWLCSYLRSWLLFHLFHSFKKTLQVHEFQKEF